MSENQHKPGVFFNQSDVPTAVTDVEVQINQEMMILMRFGYRSYENLGKPIDSKSCVTMTPQTMKKLAFALNNMVQAYENACGPIRIPELEGQQVVSTGKGDKLPS